MSIFLEVKHFWLKVAKHCFWFRCMNVPINDIAHYETAKIVKQNITLKVEFYLP